MKLRLVLSSVAVFAVPGCFNPSDSPLDPTATDSSGGATETEASSGTTLGTGPTTSPATDGSSSGTSSTTVDSDSLDTTSGTPGAPSVELTADGDAGPVTVEHGRRLVLNADAAADGAIERVEFYDGGALLATDSEPPYSTELVLTSQESGEHTLQARAFDEGGQEAIDELELAVNIVGGTVEVSQTEVVLVGGPLFHPGGGAVIGPEGSVIVVVPVISNAFEYIATAAISYSPDLRSVNWQLTDPTTLAEGEPFRMPMGRPYLNEAQDEVVIGGTADDAGIPFGGENSVMLRYAVDGSGPLPYTEVSHSAGSNAYGHAGLAVAPSGHVYLPGPDSDVSRFSPNNGAPTWAEAGGPAYSPSQSSGVYRIMTDSAGAVITETLSCADGECTATLRKLRAIDGINQFTEAIVVPSSGFGYALGGSGVVADDDVVSIFALTASGDSGVRFVRRDADGAEQINIDVLAGDSYRIADVRGEPSGEVLAAGIRLDKGGSVGWIGRFGLDGEPVWDAPLSFGENADAVISMTPDGDGQVVVVGFSDGGSGFGLYGGQLWVATVDL